MEIRLPNKKTVYIETSWDDGSRYDLHLLDLLRRYNLPGMFYIPTHTRELTDDQVREIAKTHEIGAHTMTHQVLRLMPPAAERDEIFDCKTELERIIGKPVTSFCYPKGKFNDRTVDLVQEAGYTDARCVDVGQITLPDDPFRRKTTIHVFQRREYGGRTWREWAREWLDMVLDQDTPFNYFHLWGHSWEIHDHDEWDNLEQFFYHMANMLDLKKS